MIRRALFLGAALGASSVAAWGLAVRPWWRSWGVVPAEAERPLPGDDLVADPSVTETRAITIDAPPETVWPWLAQMGYGRAGWYSYDQLDMDGHSSDYIDARWQALDVGTVLATHPGGGFVVRVLEPGRALGLYIDTELATEQAAAAKAANTGLETAPANVRRTGGMLASATPPDFKVSWTFVLEPTDAGSTRLIERIRGTFVVPDRPTVRGRDPMQMAWPLMGFGVFVMMRKQLLGIKARVEGFGGAEERPVITPAPQPAA
ncbi:MAG: hypothetical protein ACHQZR_08425 [Candidatus Limnocylindrales bacterium]